MDKVYSEEQLIYILLAFYSKRQKLLDAIALTRITQDLINAFRKKPRNTSRKYSETTFSCCICEEKEKIFKILWKKHRLKDENVTETASEEAARKAWSDVAELQNGESYNTAATENDNEISQSKDLLQKHGLETCITEVITLTKVQLEKKWSLLSERVKTELEQCFSSVMTVNGNTCPVTAEFRPGYRKWGLHNVYLSLLTSGKAISYANFLQNIKNVGIQIKATRNPSPAVAIKYVICEHCLREADQKRPLSITDVFSQCITDLANNEFFSPLKFPNDVSSTVFKDVTTSDISSSGAITMGESSSSSEVKLKPVRKSGRGKISSKKDQSFVYYSNVDGCERLVDGKKTLNSKKALQAKRLKVFSKKKPNLDIIVMKTSELQDDLQVSQETHVPATTKDVSPITSTSLSISPVTPLIVSNEDKAVRTLQQSLESNKPRKTTLNNAREQMVTMRHIGTNKIVVVPASTLISAQQKGCLVPVKLSSINTSININKNKGAQDLSKGYPLSLNTTNQQFGSKAHQKKPLVVQIVNGRVRKGIGITKNFSRIDTNGTTRMNFDKKPPMSLRWKYGTDSRGANGLTSIKSVPISSSHVKFVKSVQLKNPLSLTNNSLLKSSGGFQMRNFMKVEVPISKYSQTRPKTLYFNNINQIPLLPGNPVDLGKFPFVHRPENPVVNNAFTKVKLRIAGNRKFVIKDNFQPNEKRFNSVINKPTLAPTLPKQIQKLTTPKKLSTRQLLSPSKTPSKRRSLKVESKSMPTIVAEYMLDHVPSANQALKKNLKKKAKKRVEKATSFIPVPYETNFLCINDTIEKFGWKAYWYRKCRCSKIREKDADAVFEEEETHPKQGNIASWLPGELSQRTNDVLLGNLEEKTDFSCADSGSDIAVKLASPAKLAELLECISQLTKEASKAKSPKLLLKCSSKFSAPKCFPVVKPDFEASSSNLSDARSRVSPPEGFSSVKDNFVSSSCSSKLPSSGSSSAAGNFVESSTNSSASCSTMKGDVEKSSTNCLNVESRKRKISDRTNAYPLPQPPVRLMAKYKKDKDGNWTAMPSEVSTISETSTRLSDPPESTTENSVMLNIKSGFQLNTAASVHMEDRMGMTHDHGVRRCARATMLRRKALMKRALDTELKSKTRREKSEFNASENLFFSSFTDQSMTNPIFDLVSPHPMCFRDNSEVMIKVIKSRDDKSAASRCLLIKEKNVLEPSAKKFTENPFYAYLTSPHPLSVCEKLKRPRDVKHSVNKASASSKIFLRKNNDAFGGKLVNKLESIWNRGTSTLTAIECKSIPSKPIYTVKYRPKSYKRKDPTVVNEITSDLAIKDLSTLRRVFPGQDTSQITSDSAQFIVSVVKSQKDVRDELKMKTVDNCIKTNQNAQKPSRSHTTQPLVEGNDNAKIVDPLSENSQDIRTEIGSLMGNEQEIVEHIENLNEETVVDVTETENVSEYYGLGEEVRLFHEVNDSIDDVPCSSKSLRNITPQLPSSITADLENSEEDVDIGGCERSEDRLGRELNFSREESDMTNHLITNKNGAKSDSKDETMVDVCNVSEHADVCRDNRAESASLTSTRPAAFVEIFNFLKKLLKTDFISPGLNRGAKNGIKTRLQKKFQVATGLSDTLSSKFCFNSMGEILLKSDPSMHKRRSKTCTLTRKKTSSSMKYQRLKELRHSTDMEAANTSTTSQEEISAERIRDGQINIDVEKSSTSHFQTSRSPQANAFNDVTALSPEMIRDDSPQNKKPNIDISRLPDCLISGSDADSVSCDSIQTDETSTLSERSYINCVKIPDSTRIDTPYKEDREAGSSKEFTLGEIVVNSSPKKRRRDWPSTALNGLYWSQVLDFGSSDSGRSGLNLRRRQVSKDAPSMVRISVNKRKRLGHSSSQKLSEILEADKSSLRKHEFQKVMDSDSDDSEDEDSSTDKPLQLLFTKSLNVDRVRSWMLGSTCPKPLILKNTSQPANSSLSSRDDTSSVNSSPVAAKRRKRKSSTMSRQLGVDDERANTSYNTLADDLSPLISRAYVPLVRCSTNLNEAGLASPEVKCKELEKEAPVRNRLFVVKKRSASREYRPRGITITKRRPKNGFHDLDLNNNECKRTPTVFTVTCRAENSNYVRKASTSGVCDFSNATQNASGDTEIEIDVESVSFHTRDESCLHENRGQHHSCIAANVGVFDGARQMRKCRMAAAQNVDNEKQEVTRKNSFTSRMNLRDRVGKDTVHGKQINHNGRSEQPRKSRFKVEKNRRLQSIRRAVFAEIKDSTQSGEDQATRRGRMLLKSRCATRGSFLSRLLGYDTDGLLV